MCSISSGTKGVASLSCEANSSIFGSHPNSRIMVSKGLRVWFGWILGCWLCWWQSWSQVYIRHMSLSGTITCMLVFKEAELCISLHCWIWIHCCWILLRSASVDEANTQRLWHSSEASATLLRQWKRHQDCQQPSSALEDKAHWNSSSLSQRSCCEGRHWYHTRQHWRAIGRYLHQALGWEEVLQVTVWAKYLRILKCPVIRHTS